jgi:hypothetical protein
MRQALRHFIATLAYRGTNVLREMPDHVATLRPGSPVRTPVEILNHVNGVLTYAYACFGHDSTRPPISDWKGEVNSFFNLLAKLDSMLASDVPMQTIGEFQLLQGPLSDAMLHLGQIGIFRRLAGSPVAGEDYSIADIRIGQLKKPEELRRNRSGVQ